MSTPTQLPPGMLATEAEIFFDGQTLQIMHDGKITDWANAPAKVLAQLETELKEDFKARKALNEAGIERMNDRLYVYAKCKHGGYNLTPDIVFGEKSEVEHWPCGCTNGCCLKPIFRDNMRVKNGVLTSREVKVATQIAQGQQSKVIASDMCISAPALDKVKQHIFKKLGVSSAPEIARWASSKNLV